jgi:antitoxin YefM
MNAIKYKAIVKNGRLDMPIINLPEGTIVEAILLIEQESQIDIDETAYLLSTEANRRNLMEGLEELKQPQNYIYVDIAAL